MRIRLDRLGDEPHIWEETLRLDADSLDRSELIELGPVTCKGRISRATPGFWFQAGLTYEQTLACMRCLEPVSLPTETEVSLLVLVDQDAADGGEQQLEEDDLGVHHVSEPVLETGDLLAEQIQLSVPMKPLCRDHCAGLCATCGADLNAGPCACRKTVDPRWAALAALRSEADDSEDDPT